MRTGRRVFIFAWGIALAASLVEAAPIDVPSGPPIRMSIEADWTVPALPVLPSGARPTSLVPGPTAELSTSDGRIIEVQGGPGIAIRSRPDGSWSAGTGLKGRVRFLVEAPLGAVLTVKVAGQSFRASLASLLEGSQRSAPQAGVEIGIERLAWDPILVDLGDEGSDGTVEPGAAVPLTVGFNVLTPEPAEVNLRCLAELRPIRGGEPVWRQEWQVVIATNSLESPKYPLSVMARGPEGTYVLELKTSWEPLADPAGTRLGRWVRRRRNPSQTTLATRRMTLAVVAPRPPAAPVPSKGDVGAGVEVDSIDLARSFTHRPSATGRSPLDAPGRTSWTVPEVALVDPSLRDRLRGWINRNAGEPSILAPADPSGLAWSAVGLRVAHPERPHRLTLTVSGGHPAALGVAMVAGNGSVSGGRGRVVLDACASGSPILEGGPPATFSWPVWPDSEAPVLVLVNRNPSAPVLVGSITLTEMVDLPAAPAARLTERTLGLYLSGVRSLDRFGGGSGPGRVDPLARSRNLASYLAHCGASTVILPEGLADRAARRALAGQADEDSTGPDRLDLLVRVLARRGCTAWVDVAFDGQLPGLPAANSPEAAAQGLVRVDRRGEVNGPSYQPIHPKVREAMARKVAEAIAPRDGRAKLARALVRLGPGSTLPGGPDGGLDDATFRRFVASAFEPGPARRVPGQGSNDPGRFEARARYVEGSGRLPWLTWRAREVASVYAGLARAARAAAPGACLAVSTPGLEPGPVGDEARRVDLAGLGPGQAWRGVGLDLAEWPTGDAAPIVFRGIGLTTEDLGHDLATSPELDDLVAARPSRGVLMGVESIEPENNPARPLAPRLTASPLAEWVLGDEPLGHALAALDPGRIVLSGASAAGQEGRIRRFARVFTALPAPPNGPPEPRFPSGVMARRIRSGSDTYLALANDTPYPILLETTLQAPPTAPVFDLARGILLDPEKGNGTTRLVLELAPFGVSAARIGAPDVAIVSATPYPGSAVLDGMKAHYDDLHIALKRLDRPSAAASRASPHNAGFEPGAEQLAALRTPPSVPGWEVDRDTGSVEVNRDRPHSGRGSLRLDARGGPAAIVSDPFQPDGRSALTIRAWLRSDRPDARVRVRVDGQSAGRVYSRQFELTVRNDWAESIAHAQQLPDGGIDSARLRFELLGPGRLWVDDVSVVGDALSESERLNARRDLTAALSAYHEKRYADFARLAGSHWSRHVATGPTAVAVDRSPVIRTGDANALPPGRRLR